MFLKSKSLIINEEENDMEKDLVEYIVKSLVDDPSAVSVNVIEGEKSTILELRVAEEDIGKVIGKHGRIAKAIRTVLQAATARDGKRTVLEILD
jgi:predicted RNA-binding protein YlqC (UPF0109 family)